MKKLFTLVVSTSFLNAVTAQYETAWIGNTKSVEITVYEDEGRTTLRPEMRYYFAPEGWQIADATPLAATDKTGRFSLHKNPARYRTLYKFTSTSVVYSKFIELFELAAERNVSAKYDTLINKMRDDFERYTKNVLTYSAIATKCFNSASGKSKKSGSKIVLRLTLVFMPNSHEQVLQSLDHLKQLINDEG